MSLPADRLGRTPIINEAGQVAMRYMRQQRVLVTCGPPVKERQYVFDMQANISLAWIPPADVPCCLSQVGGCCGQQKRGIVIYASEADVRQWTNHGGR